MQTNEFKKLNTDLRWSYIKLKQYVYYDNTLIDLRIKIANYENGNIKIKLKNLTNVLIQYKNGDTDYINNKLNQIKYVIRPKKINNSQFGDEIKYTLINNENIKTSYDVDKFIHYIDCDVELHILSILWLKQFGFTIENDIGYWCYAYRLIRSESGKGLFYPYHHKYKKWRDNALNSAINSHNEGNDVAFLSLDIKEFFDSVDLDLSKYEKLNEEYNYLNNILSEIHAYYAALRKSNKKILPIGLLSSGVLANHYLSSFDNLVFDKLKPKYYGRYVDDILIVLAKANIKTNVDLLEKYLLKTGIFNKESGSFKIKFMANMAIQESKAKAYLFKKKDSIAILEDFSLRIRETSSEFRFLPEEEAVFSDFNNNSYKIKYSGSINKIRSIEGLESDKFGASRHLAAIITSLKFIKTKKPDYILREQLIEYFIGQRNIEYYDMWERVLTVFVLCSDRVGFKQYIKNTLVDIFKIECKHNNKLIDSLLKHLANCISMAVSLDIKFYDNKINDDLKKIGSKIYKNVILSQYFTFDIIINKSSDLINSNLFRHSHTYFPLLSVCKGSAKTSLKDYCFSSVENWELDWSKIDFYPRFVHLHELFIFYKVRSAFIFDNVPMVKSVYKHYIESNLLSEDSLSWCPKPDEGIVDGLTFISQTKYENSFNKIRASLVNMYVDPNDSKSNLKGKPNLERNRFFKINKLLNNSVKEKCDIIIFPEISIPVQWINYIAMFSKKNFCTTIFGLEHFSNSKNEAFNFSVVNLPFKNSKITNCYVDMRLKIDYAPDEVEQFLDKYTVPIKMQNNERLKIYGWKGNYFTVFNCYELTNINSRGLFKGNVDFIVVIVHNRDTPYFSNIIESYSRDAHAFILQVNTSNYGDSRITQPTSTATKDIARVKGGKNHHILVEDLDVDSLRAFQKLSIAEQKKSKRFKFTPPKFDEAMASYRK